MNKNEIYVPINSRKEAKQAKAVLRALGEPVWDKFMPNDHRENKLIFSGGDWFVTYSDKKLTEITLKQLGKLLVSESEDSAKGNDTLGKIAVKVENEKEFKAIEKHLGKQSFFQPPFQSVSYPAFIYLDGGKYPNKDFVSIDCGEIYLKDYQIIPFAEFAEDKGIKLPLLTSEDGIDLYEGYRFYPCSKCGEVWITDNFTNNGYELSKSSMILSSDNEKRKAFSTQESRYKFMEAQKPKSIQMGASITIYQDHVKLCNGLDTFEKKTLQLILSQMEELNNG